MVAIMGPEDVVEGGLEKDNTMIATGGVITGLAALKRQDSARSQHFHPPPPSSAPEKRKPKRKPKANVVVVRGKIRLYSPSGFFLFLGILILMVGITMAVLGYWPQEADKKYPVASKSEIPDNGSHVITNHAGVLMEFFEQHLHSAKMKMIGPFTMGIGIFIFICANAILHENRDKETKVIHMQDIYSTVIDIHSQRVKEQRHMNGAWIGQSGNSDVKCSDNQCAAKLAANVLLSFSGSPNDRITPQKWNAYEEEDGLPKDINTLLYPKTLTLSASSYRLQTESQSYLKKCETKSIVSSSISAFTLPVIKLNNCVIDEPELDNITEDFDLSKGRIRHISTTSLTVPSTDVNDSYKPPNPRLLRSNTTVSGGKPPSASSGASMGIFLSPGFPKKEFGSNTSLHMLSCHSKSLDLERGSSTLTVQTEQRKHPSWPRLDRSNSKGYVKLENKEDPMDTLPVPQAAVKNSYTNKEKLLMISRSHNNLSFENDEFLGNKLRRGASETRF
ncbi:transmembrane protein 200A isoform X1 [Scyliorhinus canicula]|uniref:transmembrane protein 200A isoform X1 n=2 Tax=Scyliorhinus canicula TaxID=7830 RepID=UPI0018F541DC|nr:transmembrane protein 200A isoform X1 [Scyliorhinus canicula]